MDIGGNSLNDINGPGHLTPEPTGNSGMNTLDTLGKNGGLTGNRSDIVENAS